jgi:hypothetical protein
MTVKVQGLMLPDRQIDAVTVSGTIDEVAVNSIAIYSGATVPTWRQLEVFNAWKRAWEGARDRNIMQQFAGVWYSGYDVDHIDEADRRTISTFASFGDNDIFIGMSAEVCITYHDAVLMIEVGFDVLRNVAQEQYFKVA